MKRRHFLWPDDEQFFFFTNQGNSVYRLPRRSCWGSHDTARTFFGRSFLGFPFHCQMTFCGSCAKALMNDWINSSGKSSILIALPTANMMNPASPEEFTNASKSCIQFKQKNTIQYNQNDEHYAILTSGRGLAGLQCIAPTSTTWGERVLG